MKLDQLKERHDIAGVRFKTEPSKCYQRHIREVYAELEPREPLQSLAGARVVPVSISDASSLILKYEWLQAMAAGTEWCCGLVLNEELIGVACFTKGGGSTGARAICGKTHIEKAVCLARGACVPWAPKNAASFLIRHACRVAYQEKKWSIFFAYSDADAGEIGTVYQAAGWNYLGQGVGRHSGKRGVDSGHSDFLSPDGKIRLTSYAINGPRGDRRLQSIAPKPGHNLWHKGVGKRKWLRENAGWTQLLSRDKHKWVWFEGPERELLKAACRYPFKPYPKRGKETIQLILPA